MRLRDSRKICWPLETKMAFTFHRRTMRESTSVTCLCHMIGMMCCSVVPGCMCSGMEALIRSQRENMAEFEAAIAANKDEITKVSIQNTYMYTLTNSFIVLSWPPAQ